VTRDDALELAKRVKRSWRTHQTLDEWCGYLMGMQDATIAGRALDDLRETEPLTFRDFGAKYREHAYRALPAAPPVRHLEPVAPRLTRAERDAALIAAGAPRHLIGKHQEAL
jgi:hypothetical protein